jgi:hypothetical protein
MPQRKVTAGHEQTRFPSINRNLKKRGWSLGCVSAIESNGRTIWIADAHRGDGKRFVVRADDKLTAFVELESAIRLYQRNPRNVTALGLLLHRRRAYLSAIAQTLFAFSSNLVRPLVARQDSSILHYG